MWQEELDALRPSLDDERWRRFTSIPDMIRYGTTLGIAGKVAKSFYPENRVDSPEHVAAVKKWIATESELGRLVGPYSREELEAEAGPCRSAPLSVIDKIVPPGAPPKYRIVENFSFPHSELRDGTRSVNADLDPSDFPSDWHTLTFVTSELRQLPNNDDEYRPNAMGVDLRDAFMHLPLHPSVRPSMVVKWEDKLYVRRVAAFGARTTPGAFGNTVDATRAILVHRIGHDKLKVFNQVDDILLIRLHSSVKREEVISILNRLGWCRSDEKEWSWTRNFTHAGVEFDLDGRVVRLQDKKRIKYLAFVDGVLKKKSYTVADMEKLAGYLCYVCQIVRDRRVEMEPIYRARTAIKQSASAYPIHVVGRSLAECLQCWRTFLSSPPITTSLDVPTTTSSLRIHTDASSKGLGIHITINHIPHARYAPLIDNWRAELSADIGAAEAWACEWALDAVIALGERDTRVEIYCDNEGVVWGWRKGWSKSRLTNRCFWRMLQRCRDSGIEVEMIRVPTEENDADRVSRPEEGHLDGLLEFAEEVKFAAPRGTEGADEP